MTELSRKKTEAEMRRCDRLSVAGYLKETGFGNPKVYWVLSREEPANKPYPAKAIAGASLGLTHNNFNGGYSHAASACNLLEAAGFRIVDISGMPLQTRANSTKFERDFAARLKKIGQTEVERLGRQRVGQDVFRSALLNYWDGKCLVTGISDRSLLRASHIIPWSKCVGELEAERLNPENGLLLSSLWDAAFEVGLISFSDDGAVLINSRLSEDAKAALSLSSIKQFKPTIGHKNNLAWHRKHHGFGKHAAQGDAEAALEIMNRPGGALPAKNDTL